MLVFKSIRCLLCSLKFYLKINIFTEYDDAKIFAIIYAVFSAYFAGVMVRLMLTLTPIVCMLSAVAFSETFNKYLIPEEEDEEETKNEVYVMKWLFL